MVLFPLPCLPQQFGHASVKAPPAHLPACSPACCLLQGPLQPAQLLWARPCAGQVLPAGLPALPDRAGRSHHGDTQQGTALYSAQHAIARVPCSSTHTCCKGRTQAEARNAAAQCFHTCGAALQLVHMLWQSRLHPAAPRLLGQRMHHPAPPCSSTIGPSPCRPHPPSYTAPPPPLPLPPCCNPTGCQGPRRQRWALRCLGVLRHPGRHGSPWG